MLVWIWRIWNLIHCWWECEMEQPLWKSIWQVFKNFNVELPAAPLLVICPQKTLKTSVQTKSCIWTFIAALLTISKKYKQPTCSSVGWWIFLKLYIHTMGIIQLWKGWSYTTASMNQWWLVKEARHRRSHIPFMWNIPNRQIHRDKSRLLVVSGWRQRRISEFLLDARLLCRVMKTWNSTVVTIAQHCEGSKYHWFIHLKRVKMVNLTCILPHPQKCKLERIK